MGVTGGSNHIYERLYRHMFVLGTDTMEYGTMQRIFNSIGEWHFSRDFPEVLLKQAKALCSSILDVYTSAKQSFTATPQKVHYQFSMLEVSRIYQGISLVPAKRLQDSEKLVRLWAHEIYRVIGDRLLDAEERSQMFNILQSVCSSKLRMSLSQAFGEKIKGSERLSEFHMRDLIFGNFMEPDADPKIYDEVEDGSKLEKIMQFYLNEYNRSAAAPMDLVLFHFAIEHIARLVMKSDALFISPFDKLHFVHSLLFRPVSPIPRINIGWLVCCRCPGAMCCCSDWPGRGGGAWCGSRRP